MEKHSSHENIMRQYNMNAEEFVKDLAENGIRFDLNPTVMWRDEATLADAYVSYIKRIDKSLREQASDILTKE